MVSVKGRQREISGVIKLKLEIIHRIDCDNPRNIEHGLHKLFKDKKLHGEWFDLSAEDVEYIKSLSYFGQKEGLRAA